MGDIPVSRGDQNVTIVRLASGVIMLDHDIYKLRQTFYTAYTKMLGNQQLSPIEMQIAYVIKQYPEYHAFLSNKKGIEREFPDQDTNPFLIMALHLSVIEQISTNRPTGIAHIFKEATKDKPAAVVEKIMAKVLQCMMMDSLTKRAEPDEAEYLKQLRHALEQNRDH